MKIRFFLPVLAGLIACNSSPVTVHEVQAARQERILQAQYFQPGPGLVPVVVKRDKGAMGGMCSINLLVKGQAVALLDTREQVTLYLPPGRHLLGVKWNGGWCTNTMVESEFEIRADDPPTLRISVAHDAALALTRTSA